MMDEDKNGVRQPIGPKAWVRSTVRTLEFVGPDSEDPPRTLVGVLQCVYVKTLGYGPLLDPRHRSRPADRGADRCATGPSARTARARGGGGSPRLRNRADRGPQRRLDAPLHSRGEVAYKIGEFGQAKWDSPSLSQRPADFVLINR